MFQELKLCFLQGFGMMKTKLGSASTFQGFCGHLLGQGMPKRILGVMSCLSGVECTPIMILDSFADVHICTSSEDI